MALTYPEPLGPPRPVVRDLYLYLFTPRAWGGVVVKALRYYLDGPRDRFPVVSLDLSVTHSFRPYHGPVVDAAPSENEYQEHFLVVKAGGA